MWAAALEQGRQYLDELLRTHPTWHAFAATFVAEKFCAVQSRFHQIGFITVDDERSPEHEIGKRLEHVEVERHVQHIDNCVFRLNNASLDQCFCKCGWLFGDLQFGRQKSTGGAGSAN